MIGQPILTRSTIFCVLDDHNTVPQPTIITPLVDFQSFCHQHNLHRSIPPVRWIALFHPVESHNLPFHSDISGSSCEGLDTNCATIRHWLPRLVLYSLLRTPARQLHSGIARAPRVCCRLCHVISGMLIYILVVG
jgi:hypothetical protein